MTTACTDSEKPRPPRPLPLRDARDVRRALARVANECRRGDLAPRQASVFVYAVSTLLAAIAASDFEARLDALETKTEVIP